MIHLFLPPEPHDPADADKCENRYQGNDHQGFIQVLGVRLNGHRAEVWTTAGGDRDRDRGGGITILGEGRL